MFIGAKFYNTEVLANTREMIKRNDNFKAWLHDHKLKFDSSGCFEYIHYEIYIADEQTLDAVNAALDSIIWYDAI